MGRRHRPFFRINAIESRNPRDGRIIEKLGHYDPIEKDESKQIVLNKERIEYWLGVGAVPSDTVSAMLAKNGIESKHADEKTARRKKALQIARGKGKLFDEADRKAAEKAAAAEEAKLKAEAEAAEAKAKAAEATAKAKEAEAAAKTEEAEAADAGDEEKASE